MHYKKKAFNHASTNFSNQGEIEEDQN